MITNIDELKLLDGNKIVFTIGCYDLLHINHIWFLTQTKSLAPGCKLLVAVISDDQTRLQKGLDRPIITQLERAKMLEALAIVDYVYLAPELKPQDLSMSVVSAIRPKYLSSTKEKWLTQQEELKKYDTKLIFLKEQGDRSTTQIIKQIRDNKS